MPTPSAPRELQRFILTSVPSVPYLEAMLLIRADPDRPWNAAGLARQLYVSEKSAAELMTQLHANGILALSPADTRAYCYQPVSPELRITIDALAEFYSTHLVDVTNLIHVRHDKRAEKFANAFIWRKNKDV